MPATATEKKKIIDNLRHLQEKPVEKPKKDEFRDVNVINDEKAKTIVLPGRMTPREGMKWLEKFDDQQNTKVGLYIPIEGAFPLDGLVNFYRVLKEVYGWTCLVPTPGFFGDTPPTLLEVQVGFNEFTQVHWGNVAIPGVSGSLETTVKTEDNRAFFALSGEVRRRDEATIKGLMELVRDKVRTDSIYRGQPVRVNFRDSSGKVKKFDILDAPKFMDVSKTDPEQLIFPAETQQLFEGTLLTPVKFADRCRALSIPLKRGILLEGPYGVGKTLCAAVAAKTCKDNGWTFIYVEDCRDLDRGLAMAEMYAPAMLFAEDIDRALGKERDSDLDRILNILDGVNTKSSEIITVLTTNNVDIINQAMVRPGRIDSVIPVRAPDEQAAIRLIRQYGAGTVHATDRELGDAVHPILGNNAAVIREAVERAKLFAVERDLEDGDIRIEATDISRASQTMRHHLDILNRKPEIKPHAMEIFGAAMGKQLGRTLSASRHIEGAEEAIEVTNG